MFNKPRLLAVCTALVLLFSIWMTYAQNLNADITGSVLRLHIRANSDTLSDQELKIKVRNRILEECGGWFASAKSPAESAQIARNRLTEIQAIAEDEIARRGYHYPVTVTVGDARFPTRSYGNIILPAGKYQALQIAIGDGAGQNWWCVMYPPLCLVDGVTSMPADSEEKLRDTLTDAEYQMITETNEAPEIQVRFKIAELVGQYLQR